MFLIVQTVVVVVPVVLVPSCGGITSSRSFGFILFQIFLMITLSSSFSWSGLPSNSTQWAGSELNSGEAVFMCDELNIKKFDVVTVFFTQKHRVIITNYSAPLLPAALDQSDTFSLDLEGGANQSEERGVEGDHPVSVQRHVHRYQPLAERKRSRVYC